MSEGREHHLTVAALSIAIAVIDSAPREWRAESDRDDMDALLSTLTDDFTRASYERSAWNVLAALGIKPRKADGPEPVADPAP